MCIEKSDSIQISHISQFLCIILSHAAWDRQHRALNQEMEGNTPNIIVVSSEQYGITEQNRKTGKKSSRAKNPQKKTNVTLFCIGSFIFICAI